MLQSRARLWLLFCVISCLNAPALTARYQPPQAASPPSAAAQAEQVYAIGPYGPSGNRWYPEADSIDDSMNNLDDDPFDIQDPFYDSLDDSSSSNDSRHVDSKNDDSRQDDSSHDSSANSRRDADDDKLKRGSYEPGYPPSTGPKHSIDNDEYRDDSSSRSHMEPEGRKPGPPDHPAYGAPEHKHHVKQTAAICLQRTSVRPAPTDVGPYEETFRCCAPADDADSCTYTDSYQHKSQQHNEFSMLDMLTSNPTAVCNWAQAPGGSCPSFAGQKCEVVRMNCTLTQAASTCGSPIEHGSLYFSTLAYVRQIKSLTCLKQAGDTSEKPYSAFGSYMQGAVETYAVMEGRSGEAVWLESEGSVEYSSMIPAFGSAAPQPVQEPYDPQLTWLKEGQMIVRLAVDEYVWL